MAFTEAQKVKIRKYLGYPDTYQQNNTRLESAIVVIGDRADTQAEVVAVLASIAAVETSLGTSLQTAGLKRAEDIEWYQSASGSPVIDAKINEGRRFCSQLSMLFGVPLAGDAFGKSGYQGDSWMGVAHQYGGIIPLG